MSLTNLRRFTLASFLFVGACAVGPDAPAPQLELPTKTSDATPDLSTWWTLFGDARLNALIERAFADNQDLRAAVARVDDADALARSADDLLPLVNARIGAGRSQTSDRSAFPRFPIVDRRNATHSVGLDLGYEVDLWGRIRAGDRAVLADLAADREAMYALRTSLASQTAEAYFRLLALDRRLELLQRTAANRQDVLRIQKSRLAAGTGTALELHQAEAELSAIDVLLPRAEEARRNAERAVLLLVGASPRELQTPDVPRAKVLPDAPAVPADLPADLLRRRPDVRSAEARLAASSARVSEARARYYPTITLTGSLGQESKDLSNLFIGPSTVWNFAAGLTQPLFGLRKLDAAFDSAEARRREAEATYIKTVQQAFAEVYDTLGALSATRSTIDAQARRVVALQAAERVASARHDAGASTFLEVLDTRRSLLAAESERIDDDLDRLLGTVAVCHAMGGGFDLPTTTDK